MLFSSGFLPPLPFFFTPKMKCNGNKQPFYSSRKKTLIFLFSSTYEDRSISMVKKQQKYQAWALPLEYNTNILT